MTTPTRGPVTRQVERPTYSYIGHQRRAVGMKLVNMSTLVLRRPRPVRLFEHPPWAPADTISLRDVVAEGVVIGQLAAIEPHKHHANRPTGFLFRSVDGATEIEEGSLVGVTNEIDRAYPEGSVLPSPPA